MLCLCIFTTISCISASEINNEASFDEININYVIDIPEINDYEWNESEITEAVIFMPDSEDAFQTEFGYLNNGDIYVFDIDYYFNNLIPDEDGYLVFIENNNVVIEATVFLLFQKIQQSDLNPIF